MMKSYGDTRTKANFKQVYKTLTRRSSFARLGLEDMLDLEKDVDDAAKKKDERFGHGLPPDHAHL